MRKFLAKLILFLILGEIVVRIFLHPLSLEEIYARNDYLWLRQNVTLNSMNWRDKEYDPDNKNGNFRIIFLGGSYTFGWYINDVNKTFPRLLEERLKEKYGDKIDVINASRHGFSTGEQLSRLQNEAIWFHPNLVIKGISLGEFYHRVKIPINPPDFLLKAYIYRDLISKPFKNWQTELGSRDYKNGFSENSAEFAEVTKNLLEMKRVSEENGAKFVILIFPELDPVSPDSNYLHKNYHESIKRFSKKNDIFVIDPLELFLSYPDKSGLVVNPLDPHPSEAAHVLVANAIMAQYDFDQDLKSFTPIFPKIKTSLIEGLGDKLDGFKHVRRIDKKFNSKYPQVIFDRINDLEIQSRPAGSLQDRKPVFLEDKLKTAKSYTHPGWPGATIEYNLEPSGNEIILSNLYGFPVLGIKQFTAFRRNEEKHSEVADWLLPEKVSINDGKLKINIDPKENHFLYKLDVLVGVEQIDIADGKIADVTTTSVAEKILDKDLKKVEFDMNQVVGSYPTFLSSEGSNPWAFVDGVMVLAKSVKVENKKFTLEFEKEVKKGSRIVVPVSIRLEGGKYLIEYE